MSKGIKELDKLHLVRHTHNTHMKRSQYKHKLKTERATISSPISN